jgi:hypothetical protein
MEQAYTDHQNHIQNTWNKFNNSNIHTTADYWEYTVLQYRNNICIEFIGGTKRYTYGEIDELSNQVAYWGIKQGMNSNTVVNIINK